MIKKVSFIFLLAFSLIGYSQSEYLKTEKEIEDFSERITKLFGQNKAIEAFSGMKPYWPLPETEMDLIKEKAVKGLNLMEKRFGKSIGVKKNQA